MAFSDKVCIICGRVFPPKSPNQLICGAPVCKKELKRRSKRAWKRKQREKARASRPMFKRACVICGKEFETVWKTQKTCGNEACRKALAHERKIRANAKIRAKKKPKSEMRVCEFCGKEFEAENKNGYFAKTCSETCAQSLRVASSKAVAVSNERLMDSQVSWDDISFFPGCRSQYDSSYCPFM